MKDFKNRLTSRKFLLTIAFGLLVLANKAFELGFSEDDLSKVFQAVLAFVGFEGVSDAVRAYKET